MSAAPSKARKKRLEKVKRIVEQAGLHVKKVYEKPYREYVVILIDDTTHGEEEKKLYELGLIVTRRHLSKTYKYIDEEDGKEYGYFELYLTDKEGAKSVWFPPKYHECLWTDCVIYQDLEGDAAQCMQK